MATEARAAATVCIIVFSSASCSAGDHTAVDDDFRPGDETGFVRCEKGHRRGGVAAVAHESERDSGQAIAQQLLDVAARALLGESSLDHGRVKLPRYDAIHADPLG